MTALRLVGLPTAYVKYAFGRPLGARLVLARPRARFATPAVGKSGLAAHRREKETLDGTAQGP